MLSKRFFPITLVAMLTLTLGGQVSLAQEGVSGTIYLRSGKSVDFEYIGEKGEVKDLTISGEIKGQEVKYTLSEIKEVVFANKDSNYDADDKSTIIIKSKDGEKYTIKNAVPYTIAANGELPYVYKDPVTNSLKYTVNKFDKISSISTGETRGKMRKNPNTGEYFPPTFVYDPYTGEELVWADR